MPRRTQRLNIYEPKVTHRHGGKRFGGYLTEKGAAAFEVVRGKLAKRFGVDYVSDADVVEDCVLPAAERVRK